MLSLPESANTLISARGGTIHRFIDISRYFSRDTYRDIVFYNHNFFFLVFFLYNDFNLAEKIHNNIYMRLLKSNSSNT